MRKLNVGTYSTKVQKLQSEKAIPSKKEPSRANRKARKGFPIKRLVSVLVVLLIAGGAVFGYMRLQALNSRVEKFDEQGNKLECTNILNPECWTTAFRPQLKQTNGFTNGLVLGMDSRTGKGDSLKNTDTIMFFSFNHETQKTMLVSIPRDFYIPVYAAKINAIYAFTGNRNPDDPFFYIKETVSQILGQPIHYFATVRFEGVVDAIDKIGGIEVCVDDTLTAQYPNDNAKPSDAQQWFFIEFPEGCQQMDGEKALVWSRFRYVAKGPSSYASDFSRARRQQQVTEAVKDKLLAEDISVAERAERYWSLMQTFNESVDFYGVSFEDILAGLAFIETADRSPINVVLDPALGGINKLIYATSHPNAGYIIQARDSSFKTIQSFIGRIWDNADFYKEQPKIVVLNLSEEKILAKDHPAVALKDKIEFYEQFQYFNEDTTEAFTGIKVFDFTAGKVNGSLNYILDYFGLEEAEEFPELYDLKRKNNEDILIVVGPEKLEVTATP
ncbi:LCP family protein [Candidatus Dojkabacteria bacterium]|uniref:LCP family protein n=1 Tax=Candidatus Dojkabacteria bacterium TaxID=2099670 RepID=A0A952AHI0_9BACT|nr:LCP family protein [Candidatus Dojkabacteria bacterium]